MVCYGQVEEALQPGTEEELARRTNQAPDNNYTMLHQNNDQEKKLKPNSQLLVPSLSGRLFILHSINSIK